jgi:DNA invertase Pin-like site-specific DNA recombinase
VAAVALAALVEFEAVRHRRRTSAGLAAAKRRGRAVGQAPYGTKWRLSAEPDGRAALESVEGELRILRRALALHDHLGRWDQTAARLTDEGHRTRHGKAWIAWKLARACRNPRALAFLERSAS